MRRSFHLTAIIVWLSLAIHLSFALAADIPAGLTYSNLDSDTARTEVQQALSAAGVSTEHIDNLMLWVIDFNDAMRACPAFSLAGDFSTIAASAIDYGDYAPMSNTWFKQNKRNYHDLLCRIVAFELVQDAISIGTLLPEEAYPCRDPYTDWLFTDGQIIFGGEDISISKSYEPYPLLTWDEATIADYFTLYDPIATPEPLDPQTMLETIQDKWQQHQIAFQDRPYNLITFWRQSGSFLAVSHAAVLLRTTDGYLLLEKTNPEAPYSATKHATTDAVKQYLYDAMALDFARYDSEVGTYLIMRNDQPL